MKFLTATIIAAGLAVPAIAQQNRVSLSISTFGTNKMTSLDAARKQEQTSSQVRILPVVGYHRMLNTRLGLGLEIGYSRYASKQNTTTGSWGTLPRSRFEESESSFNEYYACPSLFSVITTSDKKFRFIPTLSIPVDILTDFKGTSQTRVVIDGTGVTAETATTTSPKQESVSVGILAGGAALYRIAGNLYAGMQLGAGFIYANQTNKGDQITIWNEGKSNQRQYTTAVDQKNEGINFQFQPAITVNYFF